MIFDDGSSIDFNTGYSTPAPSGMLLGDSVPRDQAIAPGSYVPGATSWLDVLNNGIGHWASYKIASVQPNPGATVYANASQPAPAQVQNAQNLLKWALLGAVVFFGVRALSKG